jgi:tetratricopeptide (TPR) repeat protein
MRALLGASTIVHGVDPQGENDMRNQPLQGSLRTLMLGVCGLLAFALAGCATQLATPQASDDRRAWILAGAGELDAAAATPLPAAALFDVSEEMHQFALQATATAKSEGDKIDLLVRALHADSGLALRYDATATLTPQDAFVQRRANCMTHTLLFIALARDLDIDARFNQVDIPPIWDLRGDNLVLYRHINARIGVGERRFTIVDLTPEEYDPAYRQWLLSDRQAEAQFYSNRSVDLLAQQQPAEALRYQLHALQLDPDQAFLWSNLSHLYLAMGNARAAETAIDIALKMDPDSLSAYGTASRVYLALGDQARASAFRQQAEKLQRRNPYYHYQLAERAYARKQLQRALDETRTAITLYPEDHRFLLLLGAVLNQLDQPELARKSIEAAIAMTADEKTQTLYRGKLDRIAAAAKATRG